MGFSVEFRPQTTAPSHLRLDVARLLREQPSRDDDWMLEPPVPADDYFTKILKACSLLERVDGSEFWLSGFGRTRWPMDVGYDMSAFVEGLPELLAGLSEAGDAEIDLYPQGVECVLGFSVVGEDVEIRCTSRLGWNPDPAVEVIAMPELLNMIHRLQRDIARGLRVINPELLAIEPFGCWLESADEPA